MGHGFVPPHLSLEFLAKAGMFHPQLPNLAGKFVLCIIRCFFLNTNYLVFEDKTLERKYKKKIDRRT